MDAQAYAPHEAPESELSPNPEGGGGDVRLRRRRRPSPKEQARREAWAREWAAPGIEYKRLRLEREGR